ncbi:MAG TPA: galactokinase [Phycisphaerae bacterium]|nr:galactokinase [Phycisphaerae bacterium]
MKTISSEDIQNLTPAGAMEAEFKRRFGAHVGRFVEVSAPGRVNLIGEHTDYNDGFVFPMAIDRTTTILGRSRNDGIIRLFSTAQNQMVEFGIDREVTKLPPTWSLYARGVAESLRAKGFLSRGMDAIMASDVPIGGGLSSSASFEIAMALALLTVNQREMDRVEMSLACQWAEHNYAAMPSGIMDQFISSMAEAGHAMLLDCRDLSRRQVPMDDPDLQVVIVNTNVKHELVQGEYTARRTQCERAVAGIRKHFPAVKALRDATMEMLEQCRMNLDPTVFRRARHVIGENQRTLDFAQSLERRDYAACGKLMYKSHESLRDDYGVSCPELDALVEISRGISGVWGARMTGGGFGGCIVALVRKENVDRYTAAIDAEYPRQCNRQATIFLTAPGAGARVIRS